MKIKLSLSLISLLLIFMLVGCQSSKFIGKDEYDDIKENDVLTVWLKNEKCTEKIKVQESILSDTLLHIVDKNSANFVFPLKDIEDVLVDRQYNNSRFDFALTALSVSSITPSQIYNAKNLTIKDTSAKTTNYGWMLMYRYKINIFSTLESGVSFGFLYAPDNYGGAALGVDLKQDVYKDYFVEVSAKVIGYLGKIGSTNTVNSYGLYSVGIGKVIIGGLGLSLDFSKPSTNLVRDYHSKNGMSTSQYYLDFVTSVKVSYNF